MNRQEDIKIVKNNLLKVRQMLDEVLDFLIPELKESDDERFLKYIIDCCKETIESDDNGLELSMGTTKRLFAWLKKRGEQKPCMIQWKGDNLKEVIDFTGKSKNFDKWFKSFEEYEKYVNEHSGIFKMFCEDGSHYEVPVGAWIVKTPDGYNVASKAILIQNLAWSEEDERIYQSIMDDTVQENQLDDKQINWLKSLKERVYHQSTWKPSEEQFKALRESIGIVGELTPRGELLKELVEQLKAL